MVDNRKIILLTCSLTIVGIFFWFGTVNLSPDSATYISVANNLSETGELFKWVNWPSAKMTPETEPFTDFAPGMVFLTYPFTLIFDDPLNAAIMLQSLIIIFYGFTLFKLCSEIFKNKLIQYVSIISFLLFPLFTRLETHFWSELPFISFSLLAFYYVIKFTKNNEIKALYIASILILVSGFLKYIGVFTLILFLVLFIKNRINFLGLIKFSIIGACGVIIWFMRNIFLYGQITRSHDTGQKLDITVFENIIQKLSDINIILPVAALIVFLTLLYLIISPFIRKGKIRAPLEYSLMLIMFGVHFIGIIVLSMFSNIDDLGARLMSPSLTFFAFTFFMVADRLSFKKLSGKKNWIAAAYLLVLLSANFYILKPDTKNKTLNEKYLWEYIKASDDFKNSSHFYSEFNLNHEIYCHIPLRVIYKEELIDVKYVEKLKNIGNSPFFIYLKNGKGYKKMNEVNDKINLNVIDTLGFKIYY